MIYNSIEPTTVVSSLLVVGFFVLLKDVDSCLDSFCLFEEVFADFEEACLGVARNANKLPHNPPAMCAIIAMLSFCW
mgnify:CR=1 FL=1